MKTHLQREKMKAFRDVFPYILKWFWLEKGNIQNVFLYLVWIQKVLSSIPISAQFGTNTAIETDFVPRKTWQYLEKLEKSGYNITPKNQKVCVCFAVMASCSCPDSTDIKPFVAVLDFVSKGQAGTWMMGLLSVSTAICSKLPHYVEDPIKCTSGPSAFLLKYCLCGITSHQRSRVGPGHSLRRSNKMYGSWDLAAY